MNDENKRILIALNGEVCECEESIRGLKLAFMQLLHAESTLEEFDSAFEFMHTLLNMSASMDFMKQLLDRIVKD